MSTRVADLVGRSKMCTHLGVKASPKHSPELVVLARKGRVHAGEVGLDREEGQPMLRNTSAVGGDDDIPSCEREGRWSGGRRAC